MYDPLPVFHDIRPQDGMYFRHLWRMLRGDPLDERWVPGDDQLWYVPRRMLILSDRVDLHTHLGLSGEVDYIRQGDLLVTASEILTDIDSLLFTNHLDTTMVLRCLNLEWSQEAFALPNSTCCLGDVMWPEMVSLKRCDWHPLQCPAQPQLLRGSNPGRCTCQTLQPVYLYGHFPPKVWNNDTAQWMQDAHIDYMTKEKTYVCR